VVGRPGQRKLTVRQEQQRVEAKTSPELSRFGSVLQSFISKEVASLHKKPSRIVISQLEASSTGDSAETSIANQTRTGGKNSTKLTNGSGRGGKTRKPAAALSASSENGTSEDVDHDGHERSVDVAVREDTLAQLLKRTAQKRKKKAEAALMLPKKCGKCVGCKQPVCGSCSVCRDNPRFGGRWEHHKKKGCKGTVLISCGRGFKKYPERSSV
jgi:hypothetical protein